MIRVIPRDLFNDGNLLTNYGHLYIALEKHNLHNKLVHTNEQNEFEICRSRMSGETWIKNVILYDKNNKEIEILRPLNSRESLSLYFISNQDEEEYEVFTTNENEEPDISCELLKELKHDDLIA